jgi:hypothetical protein
MKSALQGAAGVRDSIDRFGFCHGYGDVWLQEFPNRQAIEIIGAHAPSEARVAQAKGKWMDL